MKTKELSQSALMLCFLVICSKISFPIGIIPISFQTLAVILIGLCLPTKQLLLVFCTYILSGLCGLPVFANGGGLSYILQPSFGFLLSFPLAAYVLSKLRQYRFFHGIMMYVGSLFALLLIYGIGVVYMYFIFQFVMMMEKGLWEIICIGVLPFLFNDLVSMGLACILALRLPQFQPATKHLATKKTSLHEHTH